MSHVLFVICIECLSQAIRLKVNSSNWKLLRIGRNKVKISPLLFENGIILFSEATTNQAYMIKQLHNDFGELSYLKISI